MEKKLKKELYKILLGTAIFFVLLVLEKTHTFPVVFENRLISFLLFLVPYFISGFSVVKKALLGIKNRQPMDESLLMTIATIGAFATGENSEAVAVMVFYQVGEWFQKYALGKSRKNIADLMDIVPEEATVEREDGSVEILDPDNVEVGDIIVIKAGDRIPVDGEIISGESMINTAALTGESVPRSVRAGDQIISGCINGDGLLRIRAIKAFEDSTVSKILELVENASEKKSKTENYITRFARVYTPIVVYAAIALAVIPSIITRDPATWFYRACTFLVVSCPCALVISVPLAFFGGIGAASSNGVLIKGSNYLELLAKLHTVVSDKTGTLTEGNFKVTDVIPEDGVDRAELLRLSAMAEGMSTHPIAISIREELVQQLPEYALDMNTVTDTENITGQGIIASVEGKKIYIGNDKLMKTYGIPFGEVSDPAATISYVAVQEDSGIKFLGAILIKDRVKKEAAEAIAGMKKEGVKNVVMLTGDRKVVGEAVAKELAVDNVYTGLLPGDKVSKLEELMTDLHKIKNRAGEMVLAFIGDGINDAPVLARADVGIAMGSIGSDAAIEAADVVIMDDDLRRIPKTVRIARKTVGISNQNIAFALLVKILVLILGALGIANMWAAVFGDVGVSVLCIMNSMRLLGEKKSI
ncbi:heavy metal translocating P-type ATPase [Oribacterium sp. WCC10]|uniref:heavy metal translocating P-type ATPase n=1 Tax=Oribacterium sp. WCC10 TaxID=1855343 RepID=UPI0008F20889|nr:heavy metal translocating P-type ATPase [Oribacterium sp. WCC10]SFG14020.1 Cd2+/Zn2+-exporting ATPase [Oribacterium sp. WCC10]